MNNIILYTATQNRQLVPNIKFPDIIQICFSIEPPKEPWIHSPLQIIDNDPARNAKYPKIMPWDFFDTLYPNWELCIWIDANMQLLKHPIQLQNYSFGVHNHSRRKCIHEEVKQCIRLKKDDPLLLQKQLASYEDHPKNYGLWECGMLVRKNTDYNKKVCQDWWQEIQTYSKRDQVSFPVIARRNNLIPESLGKDLRRSQWVKLHHLR